MTDVVPVDDPVEVEEHGIELGREGKAALLVPWKRLSGFACIIHVTEEGPGRPWKEDKRLMAFLDSL